MAKKADGKIKNPWLIKFALGWAGRGKLNALNKASKDCKKSQEKILKNILNWAKDTEYGKEHNFADIKTFDDYKKNVPINSYEDLEPLIKRHTNGESDILFPGKPIMYATTSGTTKEPKWIPLTEKYYKECYNGLSKLWFYSLMRECPTVFEGPELSIVGKPLEGYAPDGTVFGSMSGHMRKYIPKFLKEVHGLPDEIYAIPDYYARYYCVMRISIEQPIRLIITGNPSTLLELHNTVQRELDDMIEDIEKGTIKKDLNIPDDIRKVLEEWVAGANPERAKELRELKEKHETLYMKHYWPGLQMVNTWKCGNSGLYLQHAKDFFPEGVKLREFSYLASEIRAGIVLDSNDDSTILTGHLAYFEFIKKDERGEENPRVYQLHEIEEGEEYFLIVTQSSGLYRYDMNDIVRVEGFYNEFPRIKFIQKGAGITSLTGEKLHETQLLSAVRDAEKELDVKTSFFAGFADFESSAYHLYVELQDDSQSAKLEDFGKKVDENLKNVNVEYQTKRDSMRVKDLQVHKLPAQAFDKFKALAMDKGYRDGQFKLTHLMIDDVKKKMFDELLKG